MTTIAEKKNKSMLLAQIGRGTYLNTNYAVLKDSENSEIFLRGGNNGTYNYI